MTFQQSVLKTSSDVFKMVDLGNGGGEQAKAAAVASTNAGKLPHLKLPTIKMKKQIERSAL